MGATYEYWLQKNDEEIDHVVRSRDACFSDLFRKIGVGNWKTEAVGTINKIIVDVYIRTEPGSSEENLVVSEHQIVEFLNKVSNIWDIPELTIANEEEKSRMRIPSLHSPAYKLHFDFTGKSKIYISSALTFVRYLWEDNPGMGKIAQQALDLSRVLPDIPFIEIFLICHLSSDASYFNSNHTLINIDPYEYDGVFTEEHLIQALKDEKNLRVHEMFRLSYANEQMSMAGTKRKITKELVTNFKRIS